MPGLPCVNHPNEITLVRCGRCDSPICVQCMVDTPVGKKCRSCARNRTHIEESTPQQVGLAFGAALATALVAGVVLRMIPLLVILAFPYGYLIAEAALRAGKRSRSLAMQVATGVAALLGATATQAMQMPLPGGEMAGGLSFALGPVLLNPWSLAVVVIAVAVSVSRVRFI